MLTNTLCVKDSVFDMWNVYLRNDTEYGELTKKKMWERFLVNVGKGKYEYMTGPFDYYPTSPSVFAFGFHTFNNVDPKLTKQDLVDIYNDISDEKVSIQTMEEKILAEFNEYYLDAKSDWDYKDNGEEHNTKMAYINAFKRCMEMFDINDKKVFYTKKKK